MIARFDGRRGDCPANQLASALAEHRRVRNSRFVVVKMVAGEQRIMGHANKRPAAERQAAAVGGRVVERT